MKLVSGASHHIEEYEDERGKCGVIELWKDYLFDVKRVYFLYDVKEGSIRGGHAHKRLRQIFVCVSGSFTLDLYFPDGTSIEHKMSVGYGFVYVSKNVWRELYDFSVDGCCMVLASEVYDPSDYIRCKEEFYREHA